MHDQQTELERLRLLLEEARLRLREADQACDPFHDKDDVEAHAAFTKALVVLGKAETYRDTIEAAYQSLLDIINHQAEEATMQSNDTNQSTNQSNTQAEEAVMQTNETNLTTEQPTDQAKEAAMRIEDTTSTEGLYALVEEAVTLRTEIDDAEKVMDTLRTKKEEAEIVIRELEEKKENLTFEDFDDNGEDDLEDLFLDYVDNTFEDFRVGHQSFDAGDFRDWFHDLDRTRQNRWVRDYVDYEMDKEDTELYRSIERELEEKQEELKDVEEVLAEDEIDQEAAHDRLTFIESILLQKMEHATALECAAIRNSLRTTTEELWLLENTSGDAIRIGEAGQQHRDRVATLRARVAFYQLLVDNIPKQKVYAFWNVDGQLRIFADQKVAEETLAKMYEAFPSETHQSVVTYIVE